MMESWAKDKGFHIPKISLLEIWPLNVFIADKTDLTVVDVGCNTGIWCHAFMNTFGDRVKTYYGVDPLEGNLNLFNRRLDETYVPFRNTIKTGKFCVGPEDGEIEINFHNEVSTLASVVLEEVTVGNKNVQNSQKRMMPQKTIETICRENNMDSINILKVDVEGYEWDVFKGAMPMIESRKIDNIYFEFGQHQEAVGQNFKQFYDLFKSNGYYVYRQDVGRNFFGLKHIEEYHDSLEQYDSMWMILASKEPHSEPHNNPFVVGRYAAA